VISGHPVARRVRTSGEGGESQIKKKKDENQHASQTFANEPIEGKTKAFDIGKLTQSETTVSSKGRGGLVSVTTAKEVEVYARKAQISFDGLEFELDPGLSLKRRGSRNRKNVRNWVGMISGSRVRSQSRTK